MTGTADHALRLRGAVSTDPDIAFTALYRLHRHEVFRLAYLLTGDRDRAEEATAEAFARVYPKWRRGGVEHLGPYVRRALVNEVNRRGRRLQLERLERNRRTGSDRGARSPEDEAADRDAVVRALLRLPRRQRAAVVLRFYADLPEREVAEALGTSVGTVKSQVSRALLRLKEVLGET